MKDIATRLEEDSELLLHMAGESFAENAKEGAEAIKRLREALLTIEKLAIAESDGCIECFESRIAALANSALEGKK